VLTSYSCRPFATFASCLGTPTCYAGATPLASCTPSLCSAPPCTKVWASQIDITRLYDIKVSNGDVFTTTSTTNHPISFTFPWIESITFDGLISVWSTPDVTGSAALTSLAFDAQTNTWTVIVTSSINWPYRLKLVTVGDSSHIITGSGSGSPDYQYLVSDCAVAPTDDGDKCVQTTTFTTNGCDSIHTYFNHIAASFEELQYECVDADPLTCPLADNVPRAATITLTLDSNANCNNINTPVGTIPSGDIVFSLTEPDHTVTKEAFVWDDVIDFRLDVNTNFAAADIQTINVVSFTEDNENVGTTLTTTKVTTVGTPCEQAATLCFTFDTGVLDAPDTQLDLLFTVVISVTFEDGTKKRSVLQANNLVASTKVLMTNEDISSDAIASSFSYLIFVATLASLL